MLRLFLVCLFFLLNNSVVLACEPIVPMIILTAPPDLMASILTGKYAGIPTYALTVLGVVICYKCVLFAWLERANMSPLKAFLLMFLGNIVSTIVGFLATAIAYSTPVAIFMGLGISLICSYPPAMRLSAYLKQEKNINCSAFTIAFLVPVMMIVSVMLFGMAQGQLGPYTLNISVVNMIRFWLWKFVAVLAGLSISMFLSTFWEEYTIAKVYRGPERLNFVPSAARANLYTFLLAGIIGAFLALPQRFQSSNFLIGLLF